MIFWSSTIIGMGGILDACDGFEPPTNALLQHWSTFVTYIDHYIFQVPKGRCDCSVIVDKCQIEIFILIKKLKLNQ